MFGYYLKPVTRPDGQKIWRIIQTYESCLTGEVSEEGYAAFDSESDAKKYLAQLRARAAELEKLTRKIGKSKSKTRDIKTFGG